MCIECGAGCGGRDDDNPANTAGRENKCDRLYAIPPFARGYLDKIGFLTKNKTRQKTKEQKTVAATACNCLVR